MIGLRAQIDRKLYKNAMQNAILHETPNLHVIEAAVEDVSLIENVDRKPRIHACVLADGTQIRTNAIVITTGTFLNGEIYQGLNTRPAGRIGDPASHGLSRTFARLGFELGRLRTATPPRLIADTIDFGRFERNPPDAVPIPFSFLTKQVWLEPQKQVLLLTNFFVLTLSANKKTNSDADLLRLHESACARHCSTESCDELARRQRDERSAQLSVDRDAHYALSGSQTSSSLFGFIVDKTLGPIAVCPHLSQKIGFF